MVLNSLRSYIKQFKTKYGEVVIACDNKKFWRRDFFPFYKANRKKDRDRSGLDWNLIFDTLGKIRTELKENFPYKVIDVDGAEADDVIGVLAPRLLAAGPVLILSSDKDFVQLQKYDGIKQYSPILKRYIETNDPALYIREHILKGDRGDGIPNFLSEDSVFVSGNRQKTINSKKLKEWLHMKPEEFCITEALLRGYKRNQMLVDLDFIPETLKQQIVDAYDNVLVANKSNMLNYFIEKKLRNLIETLDEY